MAAFLSHSLLFSHTCVTHTLPSPLAHSLLHFFLTALLWLQQGESKEEGGVCVWGGHGGSGFARSHIHKKTMLCNLIFIAHPPPPPEISIFFCWGVVDGSAPGALMMLESRLMRCHGGDTSSAHPSNLPLKHAASKTLCLHSRKSKRHQMISAAPQKSKVRGGFSDGVALGLAAELQVQTLGPK